MSKKTKRAKLPKRIAGVKLPKEVRKQAAKAIAELKQPIVREMIAGAMGMAASAMAKQGSAAARVPRPAPASNAEAKTDWSKPDVPKSGGGQLAEIAAGLAVVGLGKLFEKMQAASDARKTEPPKA